MTWATCEDDSSHQPSGPSKVRYTVHVDSMVAILALVMRKLLEAAMVLWHAAEVAGAARHHGGEQS